MANRAHLAVHCCRRCDYVSPGAGGGHGLLAEIDQSLVVVDFVVVHHAAMAVIGVLAEAGVGHHDHFRHGVLGNARHARDQTVFAPGVAAVGIEMMGHAKGHHRLDAGTGIALDFAGQFALGNALHAGHAGDRHEVVDVFLDEDRQDQIVQAELGFLEQTAQARIAAQTAGTCFGELTGHGAFPENSG